MRNVRHADDTTLQNTRQKDYKQSILERVVMENEIKGLHLNVKKLVSMAIAKKSLCWTYLLVVSKTASQLSYLRSLITDDGSMEHETKNCTAKTA